MIAIKKSNIVFALSKFLSSSLPMEGVELTSMNQTVKCSYVLFSVEISLSLSFSTFSSELLALRQSSTRGFSHVVLFRHGRHWTMPQLG